MFCCLLSSAWLTIIGKIAAKWVINLDETNFTPSYRKTKGDCSEVRSSGDRETSDEAGVCETSVQLSDT